MNAFTTEQVTQLLIDWSNGDKAAVDKLMPLVYDELRRLARYYMRRERAGATLQTTALVNSKRGGDVRKVSLDQAAIVSTGRSSDLVALDEALTDLEAIDQRKSKVVELRFFGGLNIEETAEVMSISPATVQREWSMAKAWLYREISQNTDR
jgi:RNA polymerase sigma-70 factor (ECF subfamily)